MDTTEILNKIELNMREIEQSKFQGIKFKNKIKDLIKLLKQVIDSIEGEENEIKITVILVRLHYVNRINIMQTRTKQEKINQHVRKELKALGGNVTKLDKYLNENVKMYFPNS